MYEYLAYYGDCMQMLDGSQTLLSDEELKKKFEQEGRNSFLLLDGLHRENKILMHLHMYIIGLNAVRSFNVMVYLKRLPV